MGYIVQPGAPGITVNTIDRETGPGAGPGASGNRMILMGAGAGTNSTLNDAVMIGNSNGLNALTDANLAGSILIGSKALQATIGATTGLLANIVGAVTIIGALNFGSLASATNIQMPSLIAIGSDIASQLVGTAGGQNWGTNLLIGNSVLRNLTGTNFATKNNVIIGHGAMQLQNAGDASMQNNVFIGDGVGQGNQLAGGGCTSNVVIGQGAATGMANAFAQNTIIGQGAGTALSTGINNVIIGFGANMSTAATNNVVIGQSTGAGSTSKNNVLIGANQPIVFTADNQIIIGFQAGAGLTPGQQYQFLVETYNSDLASVKPFLYGRMDLGTLIVGTLPNASRAGFMASGTNLLAITTGTKGAANPVGGGYLYAPAAGALHWVDVNGVDSQLSAPLAGQLAGNVLTAYTNNAAAAVGTLTNAPAAGNPTKWIPINDNGTIRNIPAW